MSTKKPGGRKDKLDPKAEKERIERELEIKRKEALEELRRKVIEEQMENDPIIKFVEDLKKEKEVIEDPLAYPLISGTPEEWSNTSKLVAKYCIHT